MTQECNWTCPYTLSELKKKKKGLGATNQECERSRLIKNERQTESFFNEHIKRRSRFEYIRMWWKKRMIRYTGRHRKMLVWNKDEIRLINKRHHNINCYDH